MSVIHVQISSGKYDLSSCSKENFPARPLELVIEILDEIISGPNYPRSTPERETWNKNFHHLFFYKTFMFNCNSFHNSLTNHKLCSYLETYCGWCKKIPNFNPIFYFSLSEKYGWIDFLTDVSIWLFLFVIFIYQYFYVFHSSSVLMYF